MTRLLDPLRQLAPDSGAYVNEVCLQLRPSPQTPTSFARPNLTLPLPKKRPPPSSQTGSTSSGATTTTASPPSSGPSTRTTSCGATRASATRAGRRSAIGSAVCRGVYLCLCPLFVVLFTFFFSLLFWGHRLLPVMERESLELDCFDDRLVF